MPDLSQYPYQNPPIFFSIGEAIASVAILLAIYQLQQEHWLVVLKVRSYIEKTVYISVSLGVLIASGSAFLLIGNPTNVFELSIFWQFIASSFIAFSIVFLLMKTRNNDLFRGNPQKFSDVIHRELARANPQRLEIILNVLLENFDDICSIAAQHAPSSSRDSALFILDVVFSEGRLVDEITIQRLDALAYILATVKKYSIDKRRMPAMSWVVKNLFANEMSFLYKHMERSGLALSSNSYELVFRSPELLANFDFFGWPTLDYKMQENLKNAQIVVLIEALSRAIETYLKTGAVPPRKINDGLHHLSEIFEKLCRKIATEEQRGVDTKYALKDDWWSLHSIGNFLGHDYVFLAYQDTLNADTVRNEEVAAEANFHSNSAINEGIAAILYKALEQLAYMEKSTDIYFNVWELLHGMTYDEGYKRGYRAPFEKRMWGQIARNVSQKIWPAALKSYLVPVGFALAADDNQRTGWMGEQAEKMRRLLYVDLKPLLDGGEKMADGETLMQAALLPDFMTYEDGMFTYTSGFGKGQKKVIPPPPRGSASALTGIDPNDRSLWKTD